MQLAFSAFSLFVYSTTVSSISAASIETTRIVNGFEIDISQIPYHAALRRRVVNGWTYTCGGSIINEQTVTTAAHCVINQQYTPVDLRIVVGTSNRLSGGRTYELLRVIVHEGYDEIMLINDIAILITNNKMSFGRTVNSVEVAPRNLVLGGGSTAIVSGFGRIEFQGDSSSVLRAAQVNIVDQSSCVQAYRRITTIYSEMLCAASTNPPRDACQGDSGGPLVSNGYLVGIVSWGEGCGDENYPGVYTRASSYYDWIVKNVNSIEK